MKINAKKTNWFKKYRKSTWKASCQPISTFWGYLFLLILAGLLIWANIAKEQSKPLISPIAVGVMPVYANEIRKEDTKSWRLYQLVRRYESNNGTMGLAVTCSKIGKINEVGYLPVKGFCFDSESDQEITVMRWFQKKLNNGWTIEEALCQYNTGKKQPSCAYSIGKLSEAN